MAFPRKNWCCFVLRQYETFSSHCNSVTYYIALHPSTSPQWEPCVDLEMERQNGASLRVVTTVLYALCSWVYVLQCVFNSQRDTGEISTSINNQKSKQIYKYIVMFLNLLYLKVLYVLQFECMISKCLYFGHSSFRQLTHT